MNEPKDSTEFFEMSATVLEKAAAELDGSPLWCKGSWFKFDHFSVGADGSIDEITDWVESQGDWDDQAFILERGLTMEQFGEAERCADGQLRLSAAIELGIDLTDCERNEVGRHPVYQLALSAANRAVQDIDPRMGDTEISLVTFNDVRAKNGSDIAEVFRRAAQKLRTNNCDWNAPAATWSDD